MQVLPEQTLWVGVAPQLLLSVHWSGPAPEMEEQVLPEQTLWVGVAAQFASDSHESVPAPETDVQVLPEQTLWVELAKFKGRETFWKLSQPTTMPPHAQPFKLPPVVLAFVILIQPSQPSS